MSVAKGFVDIQVNGYMGTDFSTAELTVEDVRKVTLGLAEKGTAGYCPTVVTSPMEIYEKSLKVIAKAMKDEEFGGNILGVHIEGPYLSKTPGAYGAHQPEYLRSPSIEEFDKFQEWSGGNIAVLTLAPELPGAAELIRHAADQGVAVMFGHHMAVPEDMQRGLDAGARGCTHMGNGLPNEIHRHKNPIWWQLACDKLSCTFVTDGHHLPAEFTKVALRAKTIDRFIVVSDASHLAGMPPGIYDGFGKKIEIEASGRLSVYGAGYLAGSHSTMLECMNYLASLGLLTESELWAAAYDNPLKLLGKSAESLKSAKFKSIEVINGKEFRLI